jgi:anti-sigma-K factor RskA
MKLDELQKKLLAAAKANPPADRVPLAFEKRVLANLKASPANDISALWARSLWRAVIPCVALTVVLTAISFVPANQTSTSNPTSVPSEVDLSQVFEQTLLASSEQPEEIW